MSTKQISSCNYCGENAHNYKQNDYEKKNNIHFCSDLCTDAYYSFCDEANDPRRMKIKIIPDNNTSLELVEFKDNKPSCKIHGAMNKVSLLEDGEGYWRCLQGQCRAGCIEFKGATTPPSTAPSSEP